MDEGDWAIVRVPFLDDLWHRFGAPALHAPIRCVQDFLIAPAFFAGNRKLRFAFDSVRESIYLECVGQPVRDCLAFYNGSPATQFKVDGMLDG